MVITRHLPPLSHAHYSTERNQFNQHFQHCAILTWRDTRGNRNCLLMIVKKDACPENTTQHITRLRGQDDVRGAGGALYARERNTAALTRAVVPVLPHSIPNNECRKVFQITSPCYETSTIFYGIRMEESKPPNLVLKETSLRKPG